MNRQLIALLVTISLLSLSVLGQKLSGGVQVTGGVKIGSAAACVDSVSSPALWLEADALSLSNNDPISSWTDISGNARHGTNTGTNRPLYRTNQINGLPAVEFLEVSDTWLDLPNFASGFTVAEIFIVIKINADPPTIVSESIYQTGLWSLGSDATDNSTHYPFTDGVIYDDFGSTIRKVVGNPTPSLAAWRLYNVRSAANDWEALLDGTSLFSTTTNTVGFNTSPKLGKDVGGVNTYYLDGFVALVAMYSRALNSSERTALKSCIASKYALTIA